MDYITIIAIICPSPQGARLHFLQAHQDPGRFIMSITIYIKRKLLECLLITRLT